MNRLFLKSLFLKYPLSLILSWLLVSCVSSQKYNLLVQSAQKNNLEKQLLADSLKYQKDAFTVTISKKDSIIGLKNKTLDSLKDKYASLQVSYIDLEKNVYEQNQDFQKNAKSYLSQIAQRDTLLRQIITQSKELIAENQKLNEQVTQVKRGVLSTSSPTSPDSLELLQADSLYIRIYQQIKNFIGQEVSVKKEGGKIQILLAHQLLFQDDKLSEDGNFVLNIIAKALKNERNTEIAILNYVAQEVAEKDAWETSVQQFLFITRALNGAGIQQQRLSQMNIAPTSNSQTEVGTSINRVEIWLNPQKNK